MNNEIEVLDSETKLRMSEVHPLEASGTPSDAEWARLVELAATGDAKARLAVRRGWSDVLTRFDQILGFGRWMNLGDEDKALMAAFEERHVKAVEARRAWADTVLKDATDWKERIALKFAHLYCRGAVVLDVGPGWADMLDRLFTKMDAIPAAERGYGFIDDVKSKYGGLRCYTHAGDDVEALVDAAEAESETICEECGKPGRLYPTGWHETLCEPHAIERGKLPKTAH